MLLTESVAMKFMLLLKLKPLQISMVVCIKYSLNLLAISRSSVHTKPSKVTLRPHFIFNINDRFETSPHLPLITSDFFNFILKVLIFSVPYRFFVFVTHYPILS